MVGVYLDRLHRETCGAAVVAFTVMAAVLLGFAALVTDAGLAYWHRRLLQNGVDGAALAGAAHLPADPDRAIAAAREYAHRNGVTDAELDAVSEPTYRLQVTSTYSPNDTIVVGARRPFGLGLRYVIGGGDTDIVATASAIVVPLAPGELWPYGVSKDSLCTSRAECKIRVSQSEAERGNFRAIDFPDSSGARDVGYYTTHNYNGPVPTPVGKDDAGEPVWNWEVASETGVKFNQIKRGLDQLFEWDEQMLCDIGQDCGAPLYGDPPPGNYHPANHGLVCYNDTRCPRVVLIPVIAENWEDATGKTKLTIIDFACFYITRYKAHQGRLEIRGHFLDYCRDVGGSGMYNSPLSSAGRVGTFLWR